MKKLLIFSLIVLFISSCGKRRLNRSTDTSEDNTIAETSFDDIYKVLSEVADDEGAVRSTYSFGSCATITITPDLPDTTFPKTLTIDFGSTGCTGSKGVTRKGRITAVFSGRYREAGTVITVTPDNYYVNDYLVEGSKIITNKGTNAGGNTSYTIEVDGQVTFPGGDEVFWESTRTREWIEGEGTTFLTDGFNGIFDDVYSVTGTANGINRHGRAFDMTITKALIFQVGCRWIKEGTVEIQPEDLKLRTIDFGDRTEGCNNKATVEIDGTVYNIKMQ